MARQKGKSGSTKPLSGRPPSWVTHSARETETLVKKLADKGHTPSEIGLILRDNYGIPNVKSITNKSISKIAGKKELPQELINLIKRIIQLNKHLEKNKKDKISKKSFETANAKLRKMIKYYKRKGELPQEWKFKLEEAEKLV